MSIEDIKHGFIVLLAIIAGGMIFKHWKNAAWMEIVSVLAIGGIMWALFTGKDIFAMMWSVITAILKVFGIHIA
ncbi:MULTISPECIES: TcpD family membrane protein [Lactococcus]|jgi:flagellar motor component MotA|uniref:Uncharacterized protein n=2 Tax=Lactococcus TaxID=1357 RepID=A0A252CAQ4_9LACT|nr:MULTISPECIES: TcpD family membrane protein [Lactococcus]OUK03653.1 hypothetical protein BZZ03_10240 [Lactococcus petauri]USI68046.1 hypothetical protein LMK04_11410 [Lactococcus petauri]USJ20305.1 hypothetical protein LMK00_10990 [Lactococcus formosensis]